MAETNDPWPQLAGDPIVLRCEDCGDDVTVKGEPEAVARMYADPLVTVLCLPCGLLRGVGG